MRLQQAFVVGVGAQKSLTSVSLCKMAQGRTSLLKVRAARSGDTVQVS